MKTIVAGSRDFNEYEKLCKALDALFLGTSDITIISGMARGADLLGARYAKEKGYKLIEMPADWTTHGKSAGYRRNEAMAEIADSCVCFWDGQSKGTKHMIDIAKKKGLDIVIVNKS